MGAFTVTDIVLVNFPFSDLSTSKLKVRELARILCDKIEDGIGK